MKQTNKKLDSLAYSGTLKVSIKKGKKTISTHKYKNSGRWPLFYFLSMCLQGNYNLADNWRPRYINFFEAGKKGTLTPIISDDAGGKGLGKYTTVQKKASLTTHPYSEEPLLVKEENNVGTVTLTYKYIIPFTQIDTSKAINLICLYSKEKYNTLYDPSMFFFVEGEGEGKGTLSDVLDGLAVGKDSEFNLFIEWTLEIKNASKE